MLKRLLFLVLLCASSAFAQVTVTGTVTDAGSIAWAGGTYRIAFVPVAGYNGPYYASGSVFSTTTTYSGTLDGTGSFSVSMIANTAITPVATKWAFNFCPLADGGCYTTTLSITGAGSITGSITPPAVTVQAGNGNQPKAYADAEITNPVVGFTYYNLTTATLRVCTVAVPCTWVAVGSGAGGPPSGPAGGQLSGTYPNPSVVTLNQNTTGTAANLSGTPALPNGTTATTQAPGDNTNDLATDAFVLANSGGLSGLTTGVIPQAASATSIANSTPQLDNGVTTANTLTYAGTGGITASSGPITSGAATAAGALAVGGSATPPTISANKFYLIGPSTATFTGLGLQFSSTAPSANNVLLVGAPSSGIAAVTYGQVPHAAIASTAVTPGSYTNANITVAADGSLTAAANGSGSSGTVTSIATTSPITGGTITTTGTIACATCVVASSPGAGIAHFAGSTQTVTSSAVSLSADVTGQLPIASVGSAGLSATAPLAIASSGAITITSPLPVANGGTGTGSTLTGLVRGNASAMTASELSGDVTTSGSNAATVVQVEGAAIPASAASLGTNSSKQLVAVSRLFGASFGDCSGTACASSPLLTAADVQYFTIPYACTINAWNITVDAGTVTFDIWKIATGTAIPTSANSITASALPALSTGTALHSTTLTGWTTAVTANDIVGIQLNTVASAHQVTLVVGCS